VVACEWIAIQANKISFPPLMKTNLLLNLHISPL
jgi:hypothetical protein